MKEEEEVKRFCDCNNRVKVIEAMTVSVAEDCYSD
jgi:hypothetical protein